jgi:hypothetical protein
VRRGVWVVKALATQHAMTRHDVNVIVGSPPALRRFNRQGVSWIAHHLATAYGRHDPVLVDCCYGRAGSKRRDGCKHDTFKLRREVLPKQGIQYGQPTRIRRSRPYESVLTPLTHQTSGIHLLSASPSHAQQ